MSCFYNHFTLYLYDNFYIKVSETKVGQVEIIYIIDYKHIVSNSFYKQFSSYYFLTISFW